MAKEVGKEDLMELDRQAQLAWDMAKIVEWYEKAKDAGSEEAEQRLADLS